MNRLRRQAEQAATSPFRLWLLNQGLLRRVPFNKPHGLKLVHIGTDELTVQVRNRTVNQNHIKSIHACLLATLCEYVTGLGLLLHLDPKHYRIILKRIEMTYLFQAKMDVRASFKLDQDTFNQEVLLPLSKEGVLFKTFSIAVKDVAGNHICTGTIEWQIKAWDKVRVRPS